MKLNASRGKQIRERFPLEAGKTMLMEIWKSSKKTHAELEQVFGIGTGTDARVNGGGRSGEAYGKYMRGERRLAMHTGLKICAIARQNGWCQSDFGGIVLGRLTKEFQHFEAERLKEMEKACRNLVRSIWKFHELTPSQIYDSLDKVAVPMLKRVFVESLTGKKEIQVESFVSVLDLPIEMARNPIANPEMKFRAVLEEYGIKTSSADCDVSVQSVDDERRF